MIIESCHTSLSSFSENGSGSKSIGDSFTFSIDNLNDMIIVSIARMQGNITYAIYCSSTCEPIFVSGSLNSDLTCNDNNRSIVIHSQHWGRSRGEYSFLPKIKSAEPLPEKLGYDSRLVMNRLGEFYLKDPGVRTFMTGYDPSGVAIESRGEYSFLPKIKSAEPLPEKLGYDSRLVMNRLGEFYLKDPGVRTFMTGYDPSGVAIEWEKMILVEFID
ncbi:hypothetical protein Glove_184g67 [Diversispora epigaea]|uniref:Uncharacterized protein n=1 Tax=Diversispora epigaea TaxID=1348612 RepID=A0A397ITX8_9GLOM|nr:hypothetical protein Glove_184g67 [Diversispora epigaea]